VKKPWPNSVREPVYATDAPRQTVSLTINSDLFMRVKALGINASRIAEEAFVQELERQRRAVILAEVEADVRAADAYMAKYGNHGELVREHYEGGLESPTLGKD
jgi:post-segregation antitoxin (ccd killing protein)